MQVVNLLSELDGMVAQGQIVEAVEKFFGDTVKTHEVDGSKTQNKAEMVEKMTGFVNSIAAVKGIKHINSVSGEDVSMSEFHFNFEMKDGSEVDWHEIIRRNWKDGKVVEEQYFQH